MAPAEANASASMTMSVLAALLSSWFPVSPSVQKDWSKSAIVGGTFSSSDRFSPATKAKVARLRASVLSSSGQAFQ